MSQEENRKHKRSFKLRTTDQKCSPCLALTTSDAAAVAATMLLLVVVLLLLRPLQCFYNRHCDKIISPNFISMSTSGQTVA